MTHTNTKKIALTSLLIALSFISLYFIRIPLLPSAPFLRFDIKDVFISMVGIFFGPIYAFGGSICISLLQMIFISEYGFIGLIMNVLSESAFTVPLAFVFKRLNTNKRLLLGLLVSCVSMTAVMLIWNYLISPLYMGIPRAAVKEMLIPVFFPFNMLKGIINSILIFLLYNSVKRFILTSCDTQKK